MAYINTDVYHRGLTNSILNGKESGDYTVVVLTKTAITSPTISADSILAVSEARFCADGNNNSDEQSGSITTVTNYIGSYVTSSKQLNIDAIPYCRTKTVTAGTANGFAIVHIKNQSPTSQVAYTKIEDGVTKDVTFAGFTKDTIATGDVIIAGALNSSVTLNNDSNFMFGGAVINFTEA